MCVTHDVEHALTIDRVLVVDGGRIVEDGNPNKLAEQEGSRYRAMIESERAVRSRMWSSNKWRRLYLADGQIAETGEYSATERAASEERDVEPDAALEPSTEGGAA